jgi:hypothetical protein
MPIVRQAQGTFDSRPKSNTSGVSFSEDASMSVLEQSATPKLLKPKGSHRALWASLCVSLALALPTQASIFGTWRTLDPVRQAQIAAKLSATPSGFGTPITDTQAWDALKADPTYAALINNAAYTYLNPSYVYPAWSDSAYLSYYTNGNNRTAMQTMMWVRQRPLVPLMWAEALERKGRFLPLLNKVMLGLATQRSWTTANNDANKTNFNGTLYTIDLNSAPLAHQLALATYLFGDKLNPTTTAAVKSALRTRIFEPYKATLKTRQSNQWLIWTSNWNPVCLAGVTGAALTVITDKNERALFIDAAEKYSNNFIDSGFTADGYDVEGLGYYNYGFSDFIVLRELLTQKTNGFVDLFGNPKLKEVAQFGMRLRIMNNVWPTIADCRANTKASGDVLWYTGHVYNLKQGNAYDTQLKYASTSDIAPGLMYAFPNSATKAGLPTGGTPLGLRTYFPYAQVLISRPVNPATGIGVAITGGNNGTSHNHNDLGSFTIASGNENLLGDPGGPTSYPGGVFDDALRYKNWKQFSSYGHPVPVVAGKYQAYGISAAAKVLSTSFTDAEDRMELDLRAGYPAATSLTTLVRKFAFSRAGKGLFTVVDSFRFSTASTFETAITTPVSFVILPGNLLQFKGATQTMYARIDAGNNAYTISRAAVSELGLNFTRIGITLNTPVNSGTVKIRYANDSSLLSVKKVVPAAIVTQPTSRWAPIGSATTFTVAATGDNLTYQWQKNGVAIAGATTSSYTIPAVVKADSGSKYSVVVKNSVSSVTSYAALLGVRDIPLTVASTNGAWFGGLVITYSLPANTTSGKLELFSSTGLLKSADVTSTSTRTRFTGVSGLPAASYKLVLTLNGKVAAVKSINKQ